MKFLRINKVLSCLDKDQKNSAVLLIFLMFVASIAELFGLGMVILIINSFFEIENNLNLPFGILSGFNFHSINTILYVLVAVFTLKYLIFVLVSFLEANFMATINHRFAYKMFKNFYIEILQST